MSDENKTPEDPRHVGGKMLNYGPLLVGKPQAPDVHISALVPNSAEVAEHIELTAEVWVPGLKDPDTGKLGLVATVRKPAPDEEIGIYSKARVKEMPEDALRFLDVEHLPAKGRAYRFECIWKLVYCCVRPHVTFDWAAKIMSLPYGGDILNPLIEKIDELMRTQRTIDELTDGNFFAYPAIFGDAKVAARDKKLAEYFGSLDKGVAQAIRDNAYTMWAIQMEVVKEDAELAAYIGEIVRGEMKKGEYEPRPEIAEAMRDPRTLRAKNTQQ